MNCARRVAIVLGTLLVGAQPPPAAWSQELLLCVGAEGTPPSTCSRDCDLPPVDTFAAALDSATDAVETEGPLSVELCLLPLPFDSVAHIESVEIDNIDGRYGSPLAVHFGSQPLCPDALSLSGEPVLNIMSSGGDLVGGLMLDLSDTGPCPAERPGVHAGGGFLTFVELVIDGAQGYGLQYGVGASAESLVLEGGGILNTRGPALRTSTYSNLRRTEVAGTRVDAQTGGQAVLEGAGDSARLNLIDSVVVGNMVDGAGVSDGAALVLFADVSADNTLIVDNAVSDGLPLIETEAWPAPYFAGERLESTPHGLSNVVVSRNRHVLFDEGFALEPVARSVFAALGEGGCGGIPFSPYEDRASPFASLAGTAGPLIRVADPGTWTTRPEYLIRRSFLVENGSGSAPLLVATGEPNRVWMNLVHVTFAGNQHGSLLSVEGGGQATVTALRNLCWDPGSVGDVLVEANAGLDGAFDSMNVARDGVSWFGDEFVAQTLLGGPGLPVGELQFAPASDLRAMSACDRHLALCPGAEPTDCQQAADSGRRLVCAPDEAAAWVPTQESIDVVSFPWPWSTSYFDPPGSESDMPGASGWTCDWTRGTRDRLVLPDASTWGDGDGVPDALGCDNEDAGVVPSHPALDGFATEECAPEGHDCYVCPEGSVVLDDDDSTGDDDAAQDDDDGQSVDDDDQGGGAFGVEEGCHAQGCGYSWTCDGAGVAVLPLLPLLAVRRWRTYRSSRSFE